MTVSDTAPISCTNWNTQHRAGAGDVVALFETNCHGTYQLNVSAAAALCLLSHVFRSRPIIFGSKAKQKLAQERRNWRAPESKGGKGNQNDAVKLTYHHAWHLLSYDGACWKSPPGRRPLPGRKRQRRWSECAMREVGRSWLLGIFGWGRWLQLAEDGSIDMSRYLLSCCFWLSDELSLCPLSYPMWLSHWTTTTFGRMK